MKKPDQNIHQNAPFFKNLLEEHTREPLWHAQHTASRHACIYTLLKKYLYPSVKSCNVCAIVAF